MYIRIRLQVSICRVNSKYIPLALFVKIKRKAVISMRTIGLIEKPVEKDAPKKAPKKETEKEK